MMFRRSFQRSPGECVVSTPKTLSHPAFSPTSNVCLATAGAGALRACHQRGERKLEPLAPRHHGMRHQSITKDASGSKSVSLLVRASESPP